MKNLKKDNKGFSLVELIVVVLIMAIIAVALAPQILKWVNNSRISSDQNTMQTVVANAQTALTNPDAYAERGLSIKIEIDDNGYKITGASGLKAANAGGFIDKFCEYSGIAKSATGKQFKTKAKTSAGAVNKIEVTVSDTGAVSGKMDVNTDSIDN